MSSDRLGAPAFWKNVTVVLGGTAMAQVIPVAILPLLTRLVPADQLGEYFLWIGATSVLTVLATARLDVAVFTAKSEDEIGELLKAVLVVSCGVGALAFLGALAYQEIAGQLLVKGVSETYLAAWTLYAVVMANCQASLAVYVYHGRFKAMSSAKIALAGSVALAQLGLCLLGAGLGGLIYSQLAMSFIVTLVLMVRAGQSPARLLSKVRLGGLVQSLKSNYRFVVFAMPSGLINTTAAQMPLFLIASRFGAESVAQYALTLRVLAGPIGLLSNSILAIFKEQASREYREKGNCLIAYRYAFKSLALAAIAPFLVVVFFGQKGFELAFGGQWSSAGRFSEILAPMFFMSFVASPLSYTLLITNKQAHDLVWQIGLIAMTFTAFRYADSLKSAVQIYAMGYSVMYVIYLLISYRAASGLAESALAS